MHKYKIYWCGGTEHEESDTCTSITKLLKTILGSLLVVNAV